MELSTLLALTCVVPLSLATPIASGPLLPLVVPRSQSRCTNYPNTIAGTWVTCPSQSSCITSSKERLTFIQFSKLTTLHFSTSSLTARHSTKTVLWRAEGSPTYIILDPGTAIVGHVVADLLSDALDSLTRWVQNHGDGNIHGGMFIWKSVRGVTLTTMNTNNHQQTYGVLAAAISALANYMTENTFGQVTFSIFDGNNKVGTGSITSS